MRAVVTGGAGFLGAHLARALAARGDDVTCLDVVSSTPLLEGVDKIRIVRCDIGSWAEVVRALGDARPEIVFHTAGILSAFAEQRPQAAYRVNAVGTFNLLEAVGAGDGAQVVFTSTIATYGSGAPKTVDEGTQQRPTTMYGVSKVFGELLGEYYVGRYGLDFRALRLPSVIGAGRGPGGASAYSSLVVSEPARGRPYAVPVPEDAVMPIVYVKDAVSALIRLAEADSRDLGHRTYGLAGFSPTAAELVAAVRAVLPEANLTFEVDPAVASIVATWPHRIDGAAAAEWGWEGGSTLEEAVADFVSEMRAHPQWA